MKTSAIWYANWLIKTTNISVNNQQEGSQLVDEANETDSLFDEFEDLKPATEIDKNELQKYLSIKFTREELSLNVISIWLS